MNHIKSAVQSSTQLVRTGETVQALLLLDSAVEVAVSRRWNDAVQVVARHAAIIAESSGDLAKAKAYNERTLAYGPENPMALYGMAKVLFQQGEIECAREYALRCYEVSLRGGTDVDRARVELLGKLWPEYGVWRDSKV